jgi:molybdate transport system regulatory protein
MVFGSGRLKILNEVEKRGSILAASKSLNMSYRAAWGKIKATEDCLGRPLLTRQVGGASGGGSKLTPLAKALVDRFKSLKSLINKNADSIFDELNINRIAEASELDDL